MNVKMELPKSTIDAIRKLESQITYLRKRAAQMRDFLSGNKVEFDEQTRAKLAKQKGLGAAMLRAGAGREGGFQSEYVQALADAKGVDLANKPLTYEGPDDATRAAVAEKSQQAAWDKVGELHKAIQKLSYEIEIAEKGIRERQDALAGHMKTFQEAALSSAKAAAVAMDRAALGTAKS